MPELKYAEAIRTALDTELAADDRVVVIGEEVGALGGVFTVTQGLQERHGDDRVIDAPIAENALVGWSIGAATEGLRPVVEIMFSDFVLLALDQIVNLAAKLRFMSNGQFSVPIVIRMPGGGGTNHGPQHSQSLESLFAHVPGLVVAMPSTASDAYWMMREAIRCDDPVIFLESKHLYFRNAEDVDEQEGPRGFGARVVRDGADLTVVTAGRMTHRCTEVAEALAADGIDVEVVDVRFIWPLDTDTISASLQKTSKLAVVYEAVEFGGWGGEVAAWAAQHRFEDLDAPIVRLGSARSPIPVQPHLEDQVVPTNERIDTALRGLAGY
ncbi:MAG: alpha-ketoacid dehydrogenase subunit beta [Thermoleophilaceae bacterium]